MAEIQREFEVESGEIEADENSYERLLNQMYKVDKTLPLITETVNPLEVSRFELIADFIGQENECLKDEAELLRSFMKYIRVNYIGKDRKGRIEAFDSVKSYNLGSLQEGLDDKESEKFKRILKKMK